VTKDNISKKGGKQKGQFQSIQQRRRQHNKTAVSSTTTTTAAAKQQITRVQGATVRSTAR